jgi:hypothetical protein
MNTISKWTAALALLSGPVVANADPVTYDFTATVTSATGVYAGAGPTATGTITIDFNAPGNLYGTIGSTTSTWSLVGTGGTFYGYPAPTSLVYRETLHSGTVSYTLTTPSSVGSDNGVTGALATILNPQFWLAESYEYSSGLYYAGTYVFSAVELIGSTAPWDSNGLPVLANATSQHNELYYELNNTDAGELDYTITSLTPEAVTLACPAATTQVGASYSSALTAAGGIPPYTFSNTGNLPGGLTLNASTGAITGTPTKVGTFNFTAQVTDSSGLPAGTVTSSCTITVSATALFAKLLAEVAGQPPGMSLANQISLAQTYYAANNVPATCSVLTGFVNEVKAQNGKKIGTTLAAQLISDAHTLEVAIGCQ